MGNKKEENRKEKKERKELVLCVVERIDVFFGSRIGFVRIGGFADVECEVFLLGIKCCLWWELL